MAKKTEPATEELVPEQTQTRYEFTHFLKDPKGAKSCLKVTGDANVFDDTQVVLESLYAQGYGPDTWGQAPAKAEPAQNGQAQAPQASNGNVDKKPCPHHPGQSLWKKEKNGKTWFSHKIKDGEGYCNG